MVIVQISCTSLVHSPYESFVSSMDVYVKNNMTIDELKDFSGYGIAAEKYLVGIEKQDQATTKFHYAHPNIWGSRCFYYFVVDDATTKVIGWGFDTDKADPTKSCGSSG